MEHLQEDTHQSAALKSILKKFCFEKKVTELGLAIIDLKSDVPKISGYNLDKFMYPASVYKIYIGAEVLRQVDIGAYKLEEEIIIKSPNDVDKDARLFPGDSRPLLKAGDRVSIDYLLDLMLSRSDNTASNCLIDLVGRENITENIIHPYGWQGSGITRKFLDRIKEDKPYRYMETTLTCPRHVAEFFYLVETEQMINSFVSKKLKEYMLKWNTHGRKGFSIPEYVLYYRKGGYLETNLYKSFYRKSGFGFSFVPKNFFILLKTIITKGWAFIRYMHDAGVVEGNNSKYVVVVFTLSKQLNPRKYFHMDTLAKVVFDYMESK